MWFVFSKSVMECATIPLSTSGRTRLKIHPHRSWTVDNLSVLRILRPMKFLPIIAVLLTLLVSVAFAGPNVYDVPLKTLDHKDTTLKAYKGKVLLVVNVASQCGLTPQYKALEKLHREYKGKGFTVLGFPCNDFGAQEPGTNDEIRQFCSAKYDVSFPLFDKLHVKGAQQHPLYAALVGKDSPFPGEIKWNFGKFLIGKNGEILKRFDPTTTPDDPQVTKAIQEALAAK